MIRYNVSAALATLFCSMALAGQPAQAQLLHQERSNLTLEGVPPPDTALAERLERYRQSRGATFLDWLPEGGMLVATRFGDVEQVHRVMMPLGAREQLTFSADPVTSARAPRTAGNGFVYLKEQGGGEDAQIYSFSANGSVGKLSSVKFVHGDPIWSNDGKRVAFGGTDRDGGSYDVYVADIGAATPGGS